MRAAVVGNIAGYGYIISRFLRERGLDVDLYISRYDESPETIYYLSSEREPWIREWDRVPRFESMAPTQRSHGLHFLLTSVALTRGLREFDVVLGFGIPSICAYLSGVPYVANANGSDLRELARESSLKGRLMRRTYERASCVLLWNVDHIGVARELELERAQFVPVALDTDLFSPGEASVPDQSLRERIGERMLLFTPTHQDWQSPEGSRWRKCNDRLIRAFARLVEEGHEAFLVYADRGMDREATGRLVDELGIGEQVARIGTLGKSDLLRWYRASHVVADQFEIGSFGGIALEAMSCGRPLISYLDADLASEAYGDEIPLLNAHTEEEIYGQLLRCLNPEFRADVGLRAREWAVKHHRWTHVIETIESALRKAAMGKG
jgi:glycosyltransferase involved in cell wall biosynthesis